MKQESFSKKNKRDFLRLDSVFPVEFQLLEGNSDTVVGCLTHQGFTSNISKGGLCLEILKADEDTLKLLKSQNGLRLNLKIHIPIHLPAISAIAKVSWFKKEESHLSQYVLGLRYERITERDCKRIMRVAYSKVALPPLALAGIIILFLAFAISAYNTLRLSSANKKLIEDVVRTAKDARGARNELEGIQKERFSWEAKSQYASAKIKLQEEQLNKKQEELKTVQKDNFIELKKGELEIEKLKSILKALQQDKTGIAGKIESLAQQEELATARLNEIKDKKGVLEKPTFEKMYQWVKLHQNSRTGLIVSFEGDGELSDQAFTYDQALAIIAFSYFKDYEQARKILDFYLTKAQQKQGFYNGYYVSTGEVSEFVIHSGPNLWLGIAALQYTKLTGDKKYILLAQEIARWIIKLQNQDQEKGLRGGPEVAWYSTEHNLDGFAFFTMLYALRQDPEYRKAHEALLSWLETHSYDNPAVPIKRGRGDATIATDTYAWSIASLGPEKLIAIHMDPEAIMKFAEDNCGTTVRYTRPEGERILVKGFDFAKEQHVARGGVISCEWTAQMILSYKLLAGYYAAQGDSLKERQYQNKAEEYLEELSKMIISSPSRTGQGEGCLPYASSEFQDTGHGWMTPKGKNTGSLSATVYALFAYYGFNPLELSGNP